MRPGLAALVAAAFLAGCCCARRAPRCHERAAPPARDPAPEVVEAESPQEVVSEAELEPIVIQLGADGVFVARRGEGDDAPILSEGDLGPSRDSAHKQASLDRLAEALLAVVNRPGVREPDGSSRLKVLIDGSNKPNWVYVQWLMQVMARADIQIYKLQFRMQRPDSHPDEGDR